MGRRRRRRRDDLAVSLFPFLSVLACVIGTLALLLASIAIGRLGSQSLASVRLADRLALVREAIAGGEAKLEVLEAQIARAEAEAEDRDEVGQRLTALGLSADISLDALEGLTNLLRRAVEIDAQLARVERQTDAVVARATAREHELAERRAAEVRLPIVIDPSGLGPEWRPWLVECTPEAIWLHRPGADFNIRIAKDELLRSDDWRRYLRRIKAIRRAIVIFMIRPEAASVYDLAVAVADRHGVRHAKLPLPGEGELDLSRLEGL